MIKRLIAIVFTASLASAALLYIGTTVLGKFPSAFASSLPALVAAKATPGVEDNSSSAPGAFATTNDRRRGADKPEDSPIPAAAQATTSAIAATQVPPASAVSGVSIAQLITSPAQYLDRVFVLSGVATSLSSDKFLINDGTGQIIVDLEDNLVQLVISNGSSLTVTGEFRQTGGQRGFELKACVVTDQNGSVVVDACEFRHGADDVNDDHGGLRTPSATDDHGGLLTPSSTDDHSGSSSSGSGSNSGSGSSGSPTEDNSDSGKHGKDDNPKP